MGVTLVSVPLPLPLPLHHSSVRFHGSPTSLLVFSSSSSTRISSSSSSSPSSVVDEASSPDELTLLSQSDPNDSPFRGCKACGNEEIERGCNGEGRIQGGIATVPGFGWWPIKAYRPCPGFIASGGRYKRQGQSMDEVASGGGGRRREASAATSSKDPSSKKRSGPKQSKG